MTQKIVTIFDWLIERWRRLWGVDDDYPTFV